MITFQTTLRKIGEYTIFQLPESASLALPSRGQVFVKGTLQGRTFEKVLEPDGRWGHWFRLGATELNELSLGAGDTVEMAITPSKDWPEPEVPSDFAEALSIATDKVQHLWRTITPMARWEWIRWINATNVHETRNRRVEVSLSKMQSGKRRPCCFNLAACTVPELSKSGRLVGASDER